MSRLRTRFAPSPTGELHLGNARTALYAALLALANHGKFLLRIEDTDVSRSKLIHEESLLADLAWLGLDWDEGPDCGGAYAPYRQSERGQFYAEFYARLVAENLAYPCFCSEEELEYQRNIQRATGIAPRYSGTCANLTSAQREARRATRTSSLRLRVPQRQTLEFNDLVRGQQLFNSSDLGDFVIQRSDGTPAFLFANAIDDSLMGVTHVLRGADHLSNTPRQQLILKLLGLPIPQYGHLSLILGTDGAPLSKRHGAQSLGDLRTKGYLPEAIINHLARLGHPYLETELLTLDQLAAGFNLTQLNRAPAHHEEGALRYWQRETLSKLDWERLWDWLPSNAHALVAENARQLFINTVRPNLLFPEDGLSWAYIIYGEAIEISLEARTSINEAGSAFYTTALEVFNKHSKDFKLFTETMKKITGVRGSNLFHPLRAAITGTLAGPELAKLWLLIPKEQIRHRLNNAS